MLILPAILGLLVMKKEIATLISGTKYLSALPIIPILMFFPLLHLINIIYQQSLILKNKTKVIGSIYLAGLIATILTYIMMFTLFHRNCRKLIKFDNKYIKAERIVLSTLLMSLLLHFTHPTIVYTKLLVFCLGAIFYFVMLLLLGGFVKEETSLVKTIFKRKKPLLNQN